MYDKFVEENAVRHLRFRHRLIPYLYSMNKKTYAEGRCLTEPMYYENPDDDRAYECPNEYYFGTEMIVCPITEKVNEKTGLAARSAVEAERARRAVFSLKLRFNKSIEAPVSAAFPMICTRSESAEGIKPISPALFIFR